MILQWFDFEVKAGSKLIYQGDTYFGFFPKAALARQEGIQNAQCYQPSPAELARGRSLAFPAQPPFPGDQLRMVDQIEVFIPDGGAHKLGFVRASRLVRREEWFFKAHFYQDPVVPGSLGLESFLQLLKFLASERWGSPAEKGWQAVALNESHEWIYRGQVIPDNHQVTIEAVVTAVDEASQLLTAEGFLAVDGRVIYGMKKFTVQPVLRSILPFAKVCRFRMMPKFERVYVTALGYELGPVVVTSAELEERLAPVYGRLNLQPGQLEAWTGISERRWWQPGFQLSAGAIAAGRKALRQGIRGTGGYWRADLCGGLPGEF